MENQPLGNPTDYHWAEGKLEGRQEILDELQKLMDQYPHSDAYSKRVLEEFIVMNSSYYSPFPEGGKR